MEVIPDHIKPPDCVQLKTSLVDPSRTGVFCVTEIAKDTEFGPYDGKIMYYRTNDDVHPQFSWEVFDLETFRFLHIVDATDPAEGNWMRYVCCARYFEEQNIVSTQHGEEVFYKALKNIDPGEELLTWFQPRHKKKKSTTKRKKSDPPLPEVEPPPECPPADDDPTDGAGRLKRKRKPKIIPDAYQGRLPLDFPESKKVRQSYDFLFEPLQPGQKRRRRKKVNSDSQQSLSSSSGMNVESSEKPDCIELSNGFKTPDEESKDDCAWAAAASTSDNNTRDVGRKDNGQPLSIGDINSRVDWRFPAKGDEYLFELKSNHVTNKNGRKVYKCDICMGLYKHMFSLKRHYLRNHVNYRYLSKADMTNCLINLAQVVQNMRERGLEIPTSTNMCNNDKAGGELGEIKAEDTSNNDRQGGESGEIKAVGELGEIETMDTTNNDRPGGELEEIKAVDTTSNDRQGGESGEIKAVDATNNDKPGGHLMSTALISPDESGDIKAIDMKCDTENTADSEVHKVKSELDDKDSENKAGDKESACKDLDANEASKDSDRASVSTENEKDTVKTEDGDDKKTNKSDHRNLSESNVNEHQDKTAECAERSDPSKEQIDENDDTESKTNKSTEQINEKTECIDENETQELPCFDSIESPKKIYSEFNMYGDRARPMPGLFRCYTCYDVFDTVEAVREHVQNHPQQEEGTCFPCDQCNMRFNYKQNLVRHKRVHEMGDHPVTNGSSPVPSEDPGTTTTTISSPGKRPSTIEGPVSTSHVAPGAGMTEGGARLHPQRPDTYQMFKCSKCKTKFESLEEMTAHVKAEHISGNKFQCQYCGKDFPSGPNMKKHVRFHLGYRVSCRYCPEVFPNVGALRKHTRLSHVDIYKAKLLDKLDADESAKKAGVVKNGESTKVNNKVVDNSESKGKAGPDISKNSKKDKDNYVYDHDISFAADEIDDGGSRFKFSCTVCKKRFSNYINMCRHRRKSHSHDKPRHEELSLSFCHKRKNAVSPVQEDPEEVAQFFANVSHNIATNLNCFIDGQPPALEKFVEHIKIEDYSGNFGYNPVVDTTPIDLTWSKYNFPPNFKPVKTVGVVTTVTQVVSEVSHKLEEDKLPADKESDIVNNRSDCDIVNNKTENKDSSLSKVNSSTADKESDIVNNTSEHRHSLPSNSSVSTVNTSKDQMGRKSSGVKMLTGMAHSQKQTTSLTDASKPQEKKFYKFKISGGSIEYSSPEVKKFLHMENGEYANFEDDLEPSDDVAAGEKVEMSRSRQTSRSDRRDAAQAKGSSTGQSCSSIDGLDRTLEDKADVDKLMEAAQAELEDLYDSIENTTCESTTKQSPVNTENITDTPKDTNLTPVKKSPESLSLMCEKLLGIRKREPRRDNFIVRTDSVEDGLHCDNVLLKQLNLASHQTAKMKLNNGARTVVPDYSDVPDGSPFYNYESIAFGTNGQVVSVCAICRKHFRDIEAVLRHHWKKHPGSVFQILEVEQGNDIDSLHFQEPSYIGALAVTDPGLDNLNSMEIFSCTKCGNVFRSVSRLHVHIVNCSPIDPVYGSKVDRSPYKTSLSKKIQKKFNSLIGKDQSSKSDLEHLKNGITSQEIKSQKRVFTGCRKRKSMLLPDSPVKAGLLPVHLSALRAGYNPNRHIRRRELTELIDTLTCEACGLKFKTIILLERHVKHCTKKEKFKDVQPLACPILDESLARLKNICFYCEKNFTYAKSLINHFSDFCQVKKARQDRGQLTDHDKIQEKEIVERLKKLEEEKLIKDPDHVKKKITWQTGRKVKRKGHSWTSVKKRKQPENDENGAEEGMDDEDKDSIETDPDSLDMDKDTGSPDKDSNATDNDSVATDRDSVSADKESVATDKDSVVKDVESVTANTDNEVTDMAHSAAYKDSSAIAMESVAGDTNSVGRDTVSTKIKEDTIEKSNIPATVGEQVNGDASATSSQKCNEFDEVDSASEKQEESNAESAAAVNDDGDNEAEYSSEADLKDNSLYIAEDTPINDTSLNCTSRYQVNKVIHTEHKRKTNPESSSKPSLLFNCISKAVDDPDGELKMAKRNVPAPQKGFPENTNSLIMPSKRKRERVSKVEEFLRNAFRRKRSSKNTKSEETSKPSTKEYSVQLDPAENEVNNVQTNGDLSEQKAQKPVRKRGRPKKVILENDTSNICYPVPEKEDITKSTITCVPEMQDGPGKLNDKLIETGQEIQEQLVTETHETEHLNSIIELVNGAIVNNDEKTEDEKEESSEKKDKTMHQKNVSSSREHEMGEDEGKTEVSDCDSDEDNQEDTIVAVLMDCLAESNNEGSLQDKQTSEVLKDTDQVGYENMNIDHELSLPNSEQKNITAEVIGDILTMQDSETDMAIHEEPEDTEQQELVSEMTEECATSDDDLKDNHTTAEIESRESELHVPETDVSHEMKEYNSSSLKAVVFEQTENVAANTVEVNTDDSSIKKKQSIDVTSEETSLKEPEEESCPANSVFSEEAKVPSTSEIGDTKDKQGSKDLEIISKDEQESKDLEIISKDEQESKDLEIISKDEQESKDLEIISRSLLSCSSSVSECESDSGSRVAHADEGSQEEKPSSEVESSDISDSAIPKSPDPVFLFEPVLSPSERVKMNKRSSAMKSSSPYTPVWVRKPSKPRLKSPDRKTASDKVASDSEKKVNETKTQSKIKQSSEVLTKPIESKNKLVTPDSPDKKNRQNAINENLKLLHKQVNLRFEENMKAETCAEETKSKPTVLPSAGAAAKKVAQERFGSTRASRSSPLRGLKRKPAEDKPKDPDPVDTNPAKRRSVTSVVDTNPVKRRSVTSAGRKVVESENSHPSPKRTVDTNPVTRRSVTSVVDTNPVKRGSVTGGGGRVVKSKNIVPSPKRTRMNVIIEAAKKKASAGMNVTEVAKEKASVKDKKVVKGRGVKR